MIFQTRKLHGSPWLVRGLLSLPIKYPFLSLTHHIIHYDVHLFRHSIPIKSHGKSDGKSRLSPKENHHISLIHHSNQWKSLVGLFGTCSIFPFSWECHHPNWRTHSIIFQRPLIRIAAAPGELRCRWWSTDEQRKTMWKSHDFSIIWLLYVILWKWMKMIFVNDC